MPRVTVITPNYNYARYLPRRLDSILSQTFGDFELVVLDNASTDDSRRVIESYLHDPRVRAVFNETNNGNVFKQWNLGLRRATGEYVWIAESDDYAEPTLLETLVDRLDRNPGAGLAICQSWFVDEHDRTITAEEAGYGPHVEGDFVANGRDFCLGHMYECNQIFNASAVLFRRSVLEAAGGAPESMRLCGDYMTYVNMLALSDIVSVSARLNHFRCHRSTSRMRTPLEEALLEIRAVHRRIRELFGVGDPDRYFRGRVPYEVGRIIAEARRPPHNKVPLLESPAVLRRLARLGPRAVGIGARTLAREQAADLARRLRLLGVVRALASAVRRHA